MDVLQIIAGVILGSGGVVGAVSALRGRHARRGGLPAREHQVRARQWDMLASHYEQELRILRGNLRKELDRLRRRVGWLERARSIDAQYIDILEAHIWQGNPAPPPARPQYPRNPEEGIP
ncbi:hypothetical protein [Sinomonas atrocyanea]